MSKWCPKYGHFTVLGKLSALEIFSAADNNLEMIREGIMRDIYSQDHGSNFRVWRVRDPVPF